MRGPVVATLLCTLVLSACASGPRLTDVLRARIGTDINDLIRTGGQPTTTYRMPNGNLVYVWRYTEARSDPGFRVGGLSFPPERRDAHCQVEMEVDGRNIIVSARAIGNSCPETL